MQTVHDKADVIIAGGSYVGLALAIALSRESHGDLKVVVVAPRFPKQAPLGQDVRGSALSRGSLNFLERLGFWHLLTEDAQPVADVVLTDSALHDAVRPELLRYELARDHELLPAMVIVENDRLGALLYAAAEQASGVQLVDDTIVDTDAAGGEFVAVTLARKPQEVLQGRLVVAADGQRSSLRARANIATTGWSYEQIGIVTIVAPELPHNGRAVQHFLPSGPFAALPMTRNRVCITWTEEADNAKRILALDDVAFRLEVEQRFGHALGRLTTIAKPQSWPLELAIARQLTSARLALAGDAAHAVHPIAGQGLNLGFRDVAALAEAVIDAAKLGLDIGHPDVLERYEQARRFDNLTSAAAFSILNGAFSNESTLARSVRGAALSLTDRLPALKQWLIAEAVGDTGSAPRLLKRVAEH